MGMERVTQYSRFSQSIRKPCINPMQTNNHLYTNGERSFVQLSPTDLNDLKDTPQDNYLTLAPSIYIKGDLFNELILAILLTYFG